MFETRSQSSFPTMTPSPLQSPSQPVSLDDAAPGTKLLGRAGLATTGVTEEVTEEVPALTVPKRGMSLPKNVRVKSNPISKGIAAVKEAALLDKAARVITVAATRGTVTETPVRKASAKVAAGKKVATSSKVNKNTKTTNEANEEDSQSSESEDEGDKEETEVTVDSKGINQTLHPIHDIKEIFKEITKSADALGFAAVAEYLGARKLNIATMCSGTESPILALDMIKKCEKFPSKLMLMTDDVQHCQHWDIRLISITYSVRKLRHINKPTLNATFKLTSSFEMYVKLHHPRKRKLLGVIVFQPVHC